MNVFRICCMLCALTGATAKVSGNPAMAAFEVGPVPATVVAPHAGGDASAAAKPSTPNLFHNLNMALLSGFFPGWKEELKKFSGGNRARTWDKLARTAARDMIGAFGVGW